MSPRFIHLTSSGSKKEPRYACLSEAKASHSKIMWADVSSSTLHLHIGLSDSPIRWRCLLRVLCPARRPATGLDCVLLKDRTLALAPRQGPEKGKPENEWFWIGWQQVFPAFSLLVISSCMRFWFVGISPKFLNPAPFSGDLLCCNFVLRTADETGTKAPSALRLLPVQPAV
jgi:hypothetical protein